MIIDIHVHSSFSYDGKSSLEDMVFSAIEKDISVICFTEHFDMNPKDQGYNFFNYAKYNNEIKCMQDKYSNRILILKGLEFSEPHLYKKELDYFNKLDFDFILGSVHWIGSDWAGGKEYKKNNAIDEIYEKHYFETFKACQSGGFDALAHIDFPKRYLDGKLEPEQLLNEIVKEIVKKDISLEINTSPLRKGYNEYHPSAFILDLYKKNGGKYFTIGSDAHIKEDIGSEIDKIITDDENILCYYQRRKRVFL